MDFNPLPSTNIATKSPPVQNSKTNSSGIGKSYISNIKQSDINALHKNILIHKENSVKSQDIEQVFQDLFNILTNTNRDSQQVVTAENLLLHIVDILFAEECPKTEEPVQETNGIEVDDYETDISNVSAESNTSLNRSFEFDKKKSLSTPSHKSLSSNVNNLKYQKQHLKKKIVSLSDSNINKLNKLSNFTCLNNIKSALKSKYCKEAKDSDMPTKQINNRSIGNLNQRTSPIQDSKQKLLSPKTPEKQKLCREDKHSARKMRKFSCPISPLAIYSTPTRSKTTPIISVKKTDPNILIRCNSTGTLKSVTTLQKAEKADNTEIKSVKKSSAFMTKLKLNFKNNITKEIGKQCETSQGTKLSKLSSKFSGLKSFNLVSRKSS